MEMCPVCGSDIVVSVYTVSESGGTQCSITITEFNSLMNCVVQAIRRYARWRAEEMPAYATVQTYYNPNEEMVAYMVEEGAYDFSIIHEGERVNGKARLSENKLILLGG